MFKGAQIIDYVAATVFLFSSGLWTYKQYLLSNNFWFYTQNVSFSFLAFFCLLDTADGFTDVTKMEKVLLESQGGWP